MMVKRISTELFVLDLNLERGTTKPPGKVAQHRPGDLLGEPNQRTCSSKAVAGTSHEPQTLRTGNVQTRLLAPSSF